MVFGPNTTQGQLEDQPSSSQPNLSRRGHVQAIAQGRRDRGRGVLRNRCKAYLTHSTSSSWSCPAPSRARARAVLILHDTRPATKLCRTERRWICASLSQCASSCSPSSRESTPDRRACWEMTLDLIDFIQSRLITIISLNLHANKRCSRSHRHQHAHPRQQRPGSRKHKRVRRLVTVGA